MASSVAIRTKKPLPVAPGSSAVSASRNEANAAWDGVALCEKEIR